MRGITKNVIGFSGSKQGVLRGKRIEFVAKALEGLYGRMVEKSLENNMIVAAFCCLITYIYLNELDICSRCVYEGVMCYSKPLLQRINSEN